MRLKKHCVFLAAVLCFALLPLRAYGAAHVPAQEHELVLLLDASGSMQTNDPQGLAKDGLQLILSSLPSNYRIGFVAYNNGVIQRVPITAPSERAEVAGSIHLAEYNGYTDAGAGLSEATALFSENADIPKTILFFSDGEILMSSDSETQGSASVFDKALQAAADQGIVIHMIGLGDGFREHGNSIVDAAEKTGGSLYEASGPEEIPDCAAKILFQDLGVRKISVGIAQTDGLAGNLTVPLPSAGIQEAKILLRSDVPLRDIVANFNGADVEVTSGKRFSVVRVELPTSSNITIDFSGATRVRAELIAEYRPTLAADVVYEDNLLEATEDVAAYTDRTATIRLRLLDRQTQHNLLDEPYFNGKQIPVSFSGTTESLTVKDGCLTHIMPITESKNLQIAADWGVLDVNMLGIDPIPVSLEAPAPVEPGFNYVPLLVILALLLVVAVWLILRHKKRVREQQPPQPEPYFSKYDYAGKVNIYVTRIPDDIDIPPQTFNLHRLYSKKQITLREILNECGLARPFPGTEEILLIAGKDKSLVILNNSDATVMLGAQVLIRKKTYPMHFGEKLHITCEDEQTEMEVHYRSVKPSETYA